VLKETASGLQPGVCDEEEGTTRSSGQARRCYEGHAFQGPFRALHGEAKGTRRSVESRTQARGFSRRLLGV
jgi:hypothetical protein